MALTQTTDTCTDNHCTWSPLISYNKGVNFTEGSMRSATSTTSGDVGGLIGSFELPTAGKYYWEWVTNTVGVTPSLGWTDITNWSPTSTSTGEQINDAKFITGNDYNTGSGRILSSTINGSTSLSQAPYGNFLTVSGGNPLQNGSVLGCAYDADNGLAWFSYNNSWIDGNGTDNSATVKSEIEAGTSGSQAFTTANGSVGNSGLFIFAAVQSVSDGNFTLRTRSEQWTGDAPSGFTSLSTKNQAAAVTFTIEDGSAHFQTIAEWSGNSSSQTVSQTGNSGFTPDWAIIKSRSFGNGANSFDSVRGGSKGLATFDSGVEDDQGDGVAFSSSGGKGTLAFTGGGDTGDINTSGRTYLAWTWLAGGAPTTDNVSDSGSPGQTPTNNSVFRNGAASTTAFGSATIYPTRASINTTTGLSIIEYVGTGSNATLAHGLGAVPKMAWFRNRESAGNNWVVYHSEATGNTHCTFLDSTNAQSAVDRFQDTDPTDAVFSVDGTTDINKSTDEHVAYIFAEVPGFSKFGSYEGGVNSTDGMYVYLGFKPAWLMIKNVDNAGEAWYILDNQRPGYNDENNQLIMNSAATEGAGNIFDLLSNGFKVRANDRAYGGTSTKDTYIYIAFAEHPFAGSVPATAR